MRKRRGSRVGFIEVELKTGNKGKAKE